MEREYTIGGILVLITIFVIALIVYFTFPSFNEAIKDIADEVFGISKQKEAELEARAKETIAENIFQYLYDCIISVNDAKGECSCYLKRKDLPEDYKIKIQSVEKGKKLILEGPTHDIKSELLENMEIWEIGDDLKPEPLSKHLRFIDFSEFKPDNPEIYGFDKDGKRYVCLTTDDSKEFKKAKTCGTENVTAEVKSLDFFENFVGRFKTCKEIERKELGRPCLCSDIDFDTLENLLGYKISAVTDGKNTKFILHDPELKKVAEREVENVTIGTTPFAKWEKPEILEGKKYMVLIKNQEGKHISMYTSFSMAITDIPYCTVDVSQKGCRSISDEYEILRRIETTQYSGKTYKQIIEESVNDIGKILDTSKKVDKTKVSNFLSDENDLTNLKMLSAAVIAAESAANPEAISITGCKGLMQFCSPAAYEEGLCKDKYCTYGTEDDRNIPSIAIPKGIKHYLRKASYFDGYTYQEAFGLAAYNGGEGTIKKAIKKTGKDDPTWQEVKEELTRDLLRDSSSLYAKWYKEDKSKVDAKIKEIKCYPYIVDYYKEGFAARGLFA